MKRPHLVHFTGIESDEYIFVRASMSFSTEAKFQMLEELNQNFKELVPTSPIQSLGLLSSDVFRLKVIGLSETGQEILVRSFESDSFGGFNFKITQPETGERVRRLKIFETNTKQGLELLIGSFIPTKIFTPKKIMITDFDKTLVDTKYSTARELYQSLKNPLNFFPPVESSIELIKRLIVEEFQPFVVSASPHFYENAIRDWLYQNQIFTANIFLKDYRKIFALFDGDLTPKDLKSQGFYKLNHIVNILLMTGVPEDLVLVGDGFESDTLIYLCVAAILVGRHDPWALWNAIKKEESFRLTNKQHFRFLSKFYQLKNMTTSTNRGRLKIYIRCRADQLEKLENRVFKLDFANQLKHLVTYYVG